MYYMELTLNTFARPGFDLVSITDAQNVGEVLGLKPREEVVGYDGY